MVGQNLGVGYLVACGVRKPDRVIRRRLVGEANTAISVGPDRLHDIVADKLSSNQAPGNLDADVLQGLEPTDRTLRQAQNAAEGAAEDAFGFRTHIEALLAGVEDARQSAPTVGGIDLHWTKSVQVSSFNIQTSAF